MSGGRPALKTGSIVCPFCPLACDDVFVDAGGSTIQTSCDLAKSRFGDAIADVPARLGEQTFGIEDWKKVIDGLDLCESPLVQLSTLTFQESRQVQTWQSEGRLRIHMRLADSHAALDRSTARDGIQSTTLGDANRHADRIWMIGNWQDNTPRLLERLQPSERAVDPIRTDRLSLRHLEHLHKLTSLAESNDQESLANIGDPVFRDLHACHYFVVFIGESAFAEGFESAISDSLVRLINRWNELAAGDGFSFPRTVTLQIRADHTFRSLMMWRSGTVNANRFSHPSQIDIRLGTPLEGDHGKATLQLGGQDGGPESCDAYVATQIAGIHYDGTIVRGDGSVTLPLIGRTSSSRPSTIEALKFAIDPTP